MIQIQTGRRSNMFIKIMDEKTALALEERGFLFTKEKINKDTTVYSFEDTPELSAVLNQEFSSIYIIQDSTLKFGGAT